LSGQSDWWRESEKRPEESSRITKVKVFVDDHEMIREGNGDMKHRDLDACS
jgi:hypothetical protein